MTSKRMVRLRCSFFRAASKEASLSRRLCGEDVVFVEVARLDAAFSSLLAFATWVTPTDPSQGVASLTRNPEY